jgi:hypothetical protein
MSRKRPDLRVLAAAAVVQAVVGTLTVRDISRRTPDQVRGPKLLWKLWAGSNTLGALGYWLVGRRRPARAG